MFTKTESKFLTQMLKTRIDDTKRIIGHCEESFANGKYNAAVYNQEKHDKKIGKLNTVIATCEKLIEKLN